MSTHGLYVRMLDVSMTLSRDMSWYARCGLISILYASYQYVFYATGQGLTVWYAIVIVIITCVSMIRCLYDYMYPTRLNISWGLVIDRSINRAGPEAKWDSMSAGAQYVV